MKIITKHVKCADCGREKDILLQKFFLRRSKRILSAWGYWGTILDKDYEYWECPDCILKGYEASCEVEK